ncbi:hypothetical protein B0H14DRAFT_2563407 [Mycena olivaceomarginata]|nr:hypothetical protein B0H14DRAFT_2563407 [Mycena olivaceomarginata]
MNRIGKATAKAREAVFVEFQPSATGSKKRYGSTSRAMGMTSRKEVGGEEQQKAWEESEPNWASSQLHRQLWPDEKPQHGQMGNSVIDKERAAKMSEIKLRLKAMAGRLNGQKRAGNIEKHPCSSAKAPRPLVFRRQARPRWSLSDAISNSIGWKECRQNSAAGKLNTYLTVKWNKFNREKTFRMKGRKCRLVITNRICVRRRRV